VSQKSRFYLLNSFVKHLPILILFGTRHQRKIGVNDYKFAHLVTMQYFLKYGSRRQTEMMHQRGKWLFLMDAFLQPILALC